MTLTLPHKTIAGNTSIFMDCLRIVASLVVFWGHAYAQWHTRIGYDYGFIDWGHIAVVIFFALSGYVISFTTTVNNRGPLQYAQARLSRLYSVVLPAIVITLLIEIIISTNPEFASHYTRGHAWPRYILSTLFMNEAWFLSASPPINGPLWSLCFEFWYYVIFGLYLFKKKGINGWILPLVACLIAGPKILVMMPIWIMGNLAYRIKSPVKNKNAAWFLIALLIGAVYISVVTLPSWPLGLGKAPLFFAGQFITDNIIGVLVAAILWLLPSYASKKGSSNKMVNMIRKFADLTFPLYVLHDPLLVLFRWIFGTKHFDNIQMSIAMLFAFVFSMLLGYLMEKNRHRWITWFKAILSRGKSSYLQINRQKV